MFSLPTRWMICVAALFDERRIICSSEVWVPLSRASSPCATCSNAASKTAIFGRLAAYIIVSPLTAATLGRSRSFMSTKATQS